MSNNSVDTKTIGSLLDAKNKNYFYIPSYQRGYRWTHKQVDDLLNDLYSFKKQYGHASTGTFYCLQPVIVREIKDSEARTLAMGEAAKDESNKLWELVDGQQRLTTIYIILKYLMEKERMDDEAFLENYRASLYHMFYESRPESKKILDNLNKQTASEHCYDNIDATHICNAYYYISQWFQDEDKGVALSKRYVGGEGDTPKLMWDNMLELLTNRTDKGSTKVIWYQLNDDDSVDPIQEFTRINNGKIPLTDTELVKALFLRKKNYTEGENVLQQVKVSMQWEEMENELQSNDFWCFISDKGVDAEDRMGELLKLVFMNHTGKDNNKIESGDVFRYYYNEFEGLDGKELQKKVSNLWTEIVDTFHTLEDWYDSPEIYNYVGFLIQSKVPLSVIYQKYIENLNSESPTSFYEILEKEIKKLMSDVKVELNEDGKPIIETEYQERDKIRKTLLLLNIHVLSSQLTEIRNEAEDTHSEASVFKFPFDLYKSQNWDIEHIDSATTNTLQSDVDKRDWVDSAIMDVWGGINKAPEYIQKALSSGKVDNLMGLIKEDQNEDDENKNFIGNLTLLDSSTNREYHNALFCRKRKYIIDKVRSGRYILTCTQYVFLKFFDDTINSTDRAKWTATDKMKYHDFIVSQLKNFLTIR